MLLETVSLTNYGLKAWLSWKSQQAGCFCVCLWAWVCVYCKAGLSKQWKMDTVVYVCVWVCVHIGGHWDTVRKELCWLVKGPWGQEGNNTDYSPSFIALLVASHSVWLFSKSALILFLFFLLCFWFLASVMRSDSGTVTSPAWPRGTIMLPRVPTLLTGGTVWANTISVLLLSAKEIKCRSN